MHYLSVSCACPWQRLAPFALLSWRIIFDAEGDNDSMVSTQSARWGTHCATWPVDHLHAINHGLAPLVSQESDISSQYLTLLDQIDPDPRLLLTTLRLYQARRLWMSDLRDRGGKSGQAKCKWWRGGRLGILYSKEPTKSDMKATESDIGTTETSREATGSDRGWEGGK